MYNIICQVIAFLVVGGILTLIVVPLYHLLCLQNVNKPSGSVIPCTVYRDDEQEYFVFCDCDENWFFHTEFILCKKKHENYCFLTERDTIRKTFYETLAIIDENNIEIPTAIENAYECLYKKQKNYLIVNAENIFINCLLVIQLPKKKKGD